MLVKTTKYSIPQCQIIMTRNENATSIETTVQNCLNICTNISNYLISLGKMMHPISDHLPTFINISNWRFRTLQHLWSQHQPQMSQKIAIVITPTTIVAKLINHNCRNFQKKILRFYCRFCTKLWHSIQFSAKVASLLTIKLW